MMRLTMCVLAVVLVDASGRPLTPLRVEERTVAFTTANNPTRPSSPAERIA